MRLSIAFCSAFSSLKVSLMVPVNLFCLLKNSHLAFGYLVSISSSISSTVSSKMTSLMIPADLIVVTFFIPSLPPKRVFSSYSELLLPPLYRQILS